MGYSETLRRKGASIWRKTLQHPFVQGLGDGTLPIERFRFYMAQDYLFLIEYSRVLALASAKAQHLEDMGKFAELLHVTLNTEMGLHRSFAQRVGIPPGELEASRPAPTTLAYTCHLLATAQGGTVGEIAASILPCQWGYSEIGQKLARQGEPRKKPHYVEWIRTYSSAEFAALADWLRGLVDRLGGTTRGAERQRMEEGFLTSSRYEYLFWEMAWTQEAWPL